MRVRDAAGRPLPEASVAATWEVEEGHHESRSGETGSDGRVTLERLGADRVRVRASFEERIGDEQGPEASAEAGRGGPSLELVLDPGPVVELRLPPEHRHRFFRYRLAEEGDPRVVASGGFESGRARVRGLRAEATYAIYATDDERLFVLLRGVAPGGPPVLLRPVEGGAVTGTVLVPEGSTAGEVAVLVDGAPMVESWTEEDGSFEIRVVPGGTLQVRAEVLDAEGASRTVVVDARPGEPVVIDAR